MARSSSALGLVVASLAIGVAVGAPSLACAQSAGAPEVGAVAAVEPPDASGLLAQCVQGADALWRGRAQEAERLARQALAEAGGTPLRDPALRHAQARCEALIGRAILASGSRDPEVIASAADALRRAWALEPSADLVDPLVASHWLGARNIGLLLPSNAVERASPAERAAIGARHEGARARTLRTMPTVRGWTWSLVTVERGAATDVRVVACEPGRCVASDLFALRRDEITGVTADARLAAVGFVATRSGLALVVDADATLSVTSDGARRAEWSGSAVYVRWLADGAFRGWNVMTRSRAVAWDREWMRAARPPTVVVGVRWAPRGRVILRSTSVVARGLLEDVLGTRDPRALECDACWLGRLRPPELPAQP